MLFSSLRAVRSGGCLPLRIALTISAKITVSKPRTSNAAAHGRFVLWGNAARLDESRQERRSHTE